MTMRCPEGNSRNQSALRSLGAAIVLLCATATARGQVEPSPEIKGAASQVLFEQGRQLMEAERLSEACPKLAESYRLEAATGTLLNLALCHEREGKTATAWLEYSDAFARASREGDEQRKAVARERIGVVEQTLSRLVLLLPSSVPTGFWIELDGVRLPAEAWGSGVPIDPGSHMVAVGAENKVSVSLPAEVGADVPRVELQLPYLLDAPEPAVQPTPERRLELTSTPGDTGLHWALTGAMLGLGATGAVFGTYFGVRAVSEWDKRNAHCRPGCDEQAVAAGNSAKNAAMISTISSGLGIAGLGLGVYLLLTPVRTREQQAEPPLRASISLGYGAISARGEF
jgi:hypothetical protein